MPGTGNIVCVKCGTLVAQNTIVSEVTFEESSGGASRIVGQFVSSTNEQSLSQSAKGGHYISRQRKEHTLAHAKRELARMCNAMNLASHHSDSAHRVFILALQRNFLHGMLLIL